LANYTIILREDWTISSVWYNGEWQLWIWNNETPKLIPETIPEF
jgi:hypothetical protein